MKRCPECNAIYEDRLDVCPTCGEPLEPYAPQTVRTPRSQQQTPESQLPRQQNAFVPPQQPHYGTEQNHGNNSPYEFEQRRGGNIIINGSVAEAHTQQFYQSKFTKVVQSFFSGEPYQLSHTSFVTIFRVEEHTMRGYPEHARDITIYGNMQNIFSVGDDVTVTARRKGNRLIARNVYNHSINGNVRIQPNVPAGFIRALVLLAIVLVVMAVRAVLTANYAAIGMAVGSAVTSLLVGLITALLPIVLGIWLLWCLIRGSFKK